MGYLTSGTKLAEMLANERIADADEIRSRVSTFFDDLKSAAEDFAQMPRAIVFPEISVLPAKELDGVRTKLIRLDDAVWLIYLFNAYVATRVMAHEFEVKIKPLATLAKDIADAIGTAYLAKKIGEKFVVAARVAALSFAWLERLIELADAVAVEKRIARRVRFFGRAARQDLADSYLSFGERGGGHPRVTRTVSTRNG